MKAIVKMKSGVHETLRNAQFTSRAVLLSFRTGILESTEDHFVVYDVGSKIAIFVSF